MSNLRTAPFCLLCWYVFFFNFRPTPVVKWFKGSKEISKDKAPFRFFYSNRVLKINMVSSKTNNNGLYTCEASNRNGDKENMITSASYLELRGNESNNDRRGHNRTLPRTVKVRLSEQKDIWKNTRQLKRLSIIVDGLCGENKAASV